MQFEQPRYKRRNIKRYAYLPTRMSDGKLIWLKEYHSLEFEWVRRDHLEQEFRDWVSIEKSLTPIV